MNSLRPADVIPEVRSADVAQEDTKKIFVGNLAFRVTSEMMKAYFSAYGQVESAKVITRGRRSLGYGFVTFSDEQHALEAHEKLNRKEFEGRMINVELARPKEQIEPSTNPVPTGTARPKNRYRGGYRRGRARRRSHGPRQKSLTSLFVANLPYEMNDEAFSDIFSKYSLESAHIVTTRNGQSRGYGFVKFTSESEQKRALEDLQNCLINDRPITVRPAFEPAVPTASSQSTEETA